MDDLRTRLDALEQHTATLAHHARQVARQLCWWRGMACGLLALALLTWALPMGTAQEAIQSDWRDLPARVAVLEQKLQHLTSRTDAEGHAEVVIAGANVRIVNGRDSSDCTDEDGAPMPNCPNGLGNLIVGYNERRGGEEDVRTGSHNVVVGRGHNFSRFGGLVVGDTNQISGDFAVVSGGSFNTASGDFAVVNGGSHNTASGTHASVSAGGENTASAEHASVRGGSFNTASSFLASVHGGFGNTASGDFAAVCGGYGNTASGDYAAVSGGRDNEASGGFASVSGGLQRTAPGEFDWVAGSLVEDE
jgi:hypothetical protein